MVGHERADAWGTGRTDGDQVSDIQYTGTLVGPDGSHLTLGVSYSPPPLVVVPPPTPANPPVAVLIGEVWHKLDAVNPPASRNTYPGGRGPNEMILYSRPAVTVTITNKYGAEASVLFDGTVFKAPAPGPTAVPVDGYVLSGHGEAAAWLTANAKPGLAVTLLTTLPTPPPVVIPPPTGAVIEEWDMQWMGYGAHASGIPATTNVLNLAFLQGTGLPVGWGNETQSQLASELAALQARPGGCRVLAGVGGQGGNVVTGNHQLFADNVLAYRDDLGGTVGGLNWDIEANALNGDDVLAISTLLAAAVPGWETVLCPNGGNVSTYLPVAVRLQKAGLLSRYGQQFYDASVSLGAAEGRIQEAIDAGIPVEKITVGMMIAPDSQHWTLAQCVTNMAAIKAKWPTIGGAFLWEKDRAQSAEWSAAMAKILV